MPFHNLEATLREHLKDLYSAEQQLVGALPGMARGAEAPGLRRALEKHLVATKGHVTRLESAFKLIRMPARGKPCLVMTGLLQEAKDILAERLNSSGAAVDAALIATAQKVERYEISAYGSAQTFAELLGMNEVVWLLQQTLEEETEADQKLTEIATSVNLSALWADESSQMSSSR